MAAQTYCKRCPIMCGYEPQTAFTGIPKDSKTPIPVVLENSEETTDLVTYCEAHYVKPV